MVRNLRLFWGCFLLRWQLGKGFTPSSDYVNHGVDKSRRCPLIVSTVTRTTSETTKPSLQLLLNASDRRGLPTHLFSSKKNQKEEQVAKKIVPALMTTTERPDPSILLSAQSDANQRFGFIAICVGIVLGTFVFVDFLDFVEWILPSGWFETWRDFTWPVPLGLIYLAAGVAHFAQKESFFAMVPPPGTWGGLWKVPAPGADKLGLTYAEYHTYWTGIAEIGGGLWLILGGLNQAPQIPALLLFLLTAAITPANIYMATHDAQAPGLPPIPYPLGHFYRGIAQCVLLGFFFKLAFQ